MYCETNKAPVIGRKRVNKVIEQAIQLPMEIKKAVTPTAPAPKLDEVLSFKFFQKYIWKVNKILNVKESEIITNHWKEVVISRKKLNEWLGVRVIGKEMYKDKSEKNNSIVK